MENHGNAVDATTITTTLASRTTAKTTAAAAATTNARNIATPDKHVQSRNQIKLVLQFYSCLMLSQIPLANFYITLKR